MEVGDGVGQQGCLLRHLAVLGSVLLPLQSHLGHRVLQLAQLHGQTLVALPVFLLLACEAGEYQLLFLQRFLGGVEFGKGCGLGVAGGCVLVGFLQFLDTGRGVLHQVLALGDTLGKGLLRHSRRGAGLGELAMLLLQVGHGLFRLAMLFLQIDEGVPLLVQHLTASHDIGGEFLLGGTGFHACKLPLHTAEVCGHAVNDLVLLGYLGVHQLGRFLGIVDEGVDMRVGIVDTVTQFVLHQELYLYGLAHVFNSVYFGKILRCLRLPPRRSCRCRVCRLSS